MFLKILYVCAVFFFFACSNSVMEVDENEKFSADPNYKGFIRFFSTGKKVQLGSLNADATQKERPIMNVQFTYDFSIGRHEVICSDYNALMEHKTSCENDSLPVGNVTYYDAILYANALSKKYNMDSAYAYTNAAFDGEGNCTDLSDLVFSPEAEAFRLPTEAEWKFAAQSNWNLQQSWTSENSDFKPHKVCSKTLKMNAICDMVGNMLEWTNDWLVRFRDTTVTNFLGSPDAGSQAEKVVKGGSFRNAADKIKLYSRGDVYSVTTSTKADYVGFRLAIGSITNPTWMSSNGLVLNSRINPVANSSQVKSIVGTYRAKLCFRNDMTGNLVFIDYSNASLTVNEIQDSMEVFHPEISPNGKRVAFSTTFEGSKQKSSIYVRDLNASGTNLVKLDVESAAIPRWVITAEGDTALLYVNNAGSNKDEATFKQNSTWMVSFANGKFGTPRKLFDGSYHGGVSSDEQLAVTGSNRLRTRMVIGEDIKDSLWLDAEQACNVSLNRDKTKRTAFLDFSSTAGKNFTGKNYTAHEVLLIADSTGKLIQGISSPEGVTFDHSEWAVGNAVAEQNDILVTTLSTTAGHQQIALVNAKDGSVTTLVNGEELWHPCFWVSSRTYSNESSLDADSAGVYYAQNAALLLTYKMKTFWQWADSIEYLALGSSRMSSGFAAKNVPFGKAFNMATVPSDMDVSYYLWNNYVLPHTPNLKVLIIGIDFDLWYSPHMKMVNKNTGRAFGYIYDKNHNYWKDGIPEGFVQAAADAYIPDENVYNEIVDMNGWIIDSCNSWGRKSKGLLQKDSTWSDKSSLIQNSVEQLRSIIESAQNKGVKVLGVIFPQSPDFSKTGAFGRYGFRRSKIPQMMQELDYMKEQYPNFKYLDENKMGSHDYLDEEAFDFDHLCFTGAEKITNRIIQAIQEF